MHNMNSTFDLDMRASKREKKVQSSRDPTGAILGRFSNTAAEVVW
jgi:hypothetical protein